MRKLIRKLHSACRKWNSKRFGAVPLVENARMNVPGCKTDRQCGGYAQVGYRIWCFNELLRPVRSASASLAAEGNPFVQERANRADWAEGFDVKEFTEEWIYFYPGCMPAMTKG